MENEQQVRTLILRVLNVAETGHPDGKPQAVYIYADGKNGRKQVTLGVGFTEDGGNLEKVLNRYIAKKGAFADQLSTHVPNIGKGILAANKNFHQLLKQAGERDPLTAEAQNSNKLLRNTVYRTQALRNEIARENWMLDRLPINMNGVAVQLPANLSRAVQA